MSTAVREIKRRIGNIENIRQITRAMNAIAMTKLTRAKRQLAAAQPYMTALESFLSAALAQKTDTSEPHPLTIDNSASDVAIMVLSSDRGLCGRFKGDLNRKGSDLLQELGGRGKIIAGGEKALAYFVRQRVTVINSYTHVYEQPDLEIAQRISRDLTSLYLEKEVGSVIVVYTHFVSDLNQYVVEKKILPVEVSETGGSVLMEPDLKEMVEFVLPLYLQSKVFLALVESKTSEHAIRRQAMKSATDNAEDLLSTLTRFYNKARQQSITREIADIVGGAEALRRT
ncbi:MAG: ATP synthase F1 subunit gamma [Candidatus Bipolaricaulota bacterium]